MPYRRFRNRSEAGRYLAGELKDYAHRKDVVVLGLPRGGVPVAFEVAAALEAPLDVFLVRKLGVPGHEELAFGAIATGSVRILNESVLLQVPLDGGTIDAIADRERTELERRDALYRGERPPVELRDRIVILVDDGLATGATMRAAAAAVRTKDPKRVVIAVPVAARETCEDLAREVDEVVCPITPEPFYAVGLWYDDFSQTTDEEVSALLRAARSEGGRVEARR